MIKAVVVPKDEHVEVRHLTKYARTKSRAAVMLGNVTLDKKATGNLTGEFEDAVTWEGLEIPESIKSKFRTARYEDGFYDSGIYEAIKSEAKEAKDKNYEPDFSEARISRARALVSLGNTHYYLP